jgi:DNA repair exonuclease SbcCD ATPase subunit
MSDIPELQRRITAALDRIGQGLDGMTKAGDAGEVDTLRQQLEDEKLANAQLEERIKKLKASLSEAEAARDDAQSDSAEKLKDLDASLQSLRQANQELRDNNKALREANAKGVGEAHLINKAMLAELEGLRATRSADKSEADAILSEMATILKRADDDTPETDTPQAEDA